MKRIVEWIIKKFLPGYRLSKFRKDKGVSKKKGE
jgi:hypothetical protein